MEESINIGSFSSQSDMESQLITDFITPGAFSEVDATATETILDLAQSASQPVMERVNSDNEDLSSDLSPRALRRCHMLTHAKADPTQFPTAADYAQAMNQCFEMCGRKVEQWACAQENHQDGSIHYHHLVRVGGKHCKRYEPVKEQIKNTHGVVVHFTKRTSGGYAQGYRYITKGGMERVAHIEGHPNLK